LGGVNNETTLGAGVIIGVIHGRKIANSATKCPSTLDGK